MLLDQPKIWYETLGQRKRPSGQSPCQAVQQNTPCFIALFVWLARFAVKLGNRAEGSYPLHWGLERSGEFDVDFYDPAFAENAHVSGAVQLNHHIDCNLLVHPRSTPIQFKLD